MNLEYILKFLLENTPLTVQIVIAGLIVWKAAELYFLRFKGLELVVKSLSNKTDEISNKVDIIIKKLDRVIYRVDKVIEPKLNKISTRLDKAEDATRNIATYLSTRDSVHISTFVSKSPIRLSEKGKRILSKSGGKEYINEHLKQLIQQIENMNPKSPYDVQTKAISLVFDLIETDDFIKVRNFMYENPSYEGENLTIGVIINIIAIYLRDKYFEKYPDLIQSKRT